MDRRMYRQSELAEHYVRTVNIFGVGSPVAKASQTTVGLSKALAASLSAVLSGVVYVFVCLKALGGSFGIGSVTQIFRQRRPATEHRQSYAGQC